MHAHYHKAQKFSRIYKRCGSKWQLNYQTSSKTVGNYLALVNVEILLLSHEKQLLSKYCYWYILEGCKRLSSLMEVEFLLIMYLSKSA